MDWRAIQAALAAQHFYNPPLTVDGLPGDGTRKALAGFAFSKRLPPPGLTPDSRLLAALGITPAAGPAEPPWMVLLAHKMGLREVADKAALEAFLKSDGATIGDPSVFPWCGDLEQTIMLDTGYGPVPSNPYLARNWRAFGVDCPWGYGAVGVFERPGPNGNEGHVGNLIGIDAAQPARFRVRGGNENNQIGDAWIAVGRLIACRKPANYAPALAPLAVVTSGGPVSQNEA